MFEGNIILGREKQAWRREDMKVCGVCEELFIKLKIDVLLNYILISYLV